MSRSFHFVGIGGIGMSGIAEILHNQGHDVRGSDVSEGTNVRRLLKLGIPVTIGHKPENVRGAQVVVVSSAIPDGNVEVIAARENNIPVVTRGEMLAEVVRSKKAIAVSGSHGKTTTTSLISAVLSDANFDPTVINGGILNTDQTSARLGTGDWFVVEADESDGAFLKLPSTINVITNIDCEHLTYYSTIENLEYAFFQFIRNLPFYGLGVVCSDHPRVRRIFCSSHCCEHRQAASREHRHIPSDEPGFLRDQSLVTSGLVPRSVSRDPYSVPSPLSNNHSVDRRLVTYGISADSEFTPTFRGENIRFLGNGTMFDVTVSLDVPFMPKSAGGVTSVKDVFIPILGQHNVLNALAAIAVAHELRISPEIYKAALASFQGVKRRFTILGKKRGVTFVDDYAHHPVEIRAVIAAARQMNAKRVVAVFQPHRYSRFSLLFDDFIAVLATADVVIVLPVYAAGEPIVEGYNNEKAVEALNAQGHETVYCCDREDLLDLATDIAIEGDFFVGLGAGNITEIISNVYNLY
ncbi:MAG: UDP-N-acetylmuramate--L-alanine ligase [Holosporales bacterium]|nr:UDP-N-acetylmuramate--L-alanine ligase [Holosporales bacterium]